jgi:hypothetical protein
MEPGTRRCHDLGQARMMVSEATARISELGWKVPRWVNRDLHLLDELGGDLVHPQAQEVLDLRAEDQHGDAGREAHGHRVGDELDHGAHAGPRP